MKKIKDAVVWVFKGLAVLCFSVMIFSATIQVFCRYVLQNSPMWTEELARYMFIAASLSAAVVAMDMGSHMEVDIITAKLHENPKKMLRLITYVLIIAFCAAVTKFGVELSMKTMSQPSPAMHIPIGLVYATIPIGCLGMILVAVEKIMEILLPGKPQEQIEER